MKSHPGFETYDNAVRFLYELQGFGVKLGLKGVSSYLSSLGNPQDSFPAVHIAGTNGKGSTAAFLASILASAGYRTALYTSPHLIDFRERMRVQGRMIPKSFVTAWVERERRSIRRRRITFFEATTALAFDWFRSCAVDIAVIETGLGGRLDATNVLDPLLTMITSISRDHAHILGNDLRDIAREKAGITKPGIPCVIGSMQPMVSRFLRSYLRDRNVPFVDAGQIPVTGALDERGRTVITVGRRGDTSGRVVSGLDGLHQTSNVALALTAAGILETSYGFSISRASIDRGLRSAAENSGLRGRCSAVKGHRRLFVDVAHNPEAMRQTVRHFRRRFGRTFKIIFGISSDKDAASVLSNLKKLSRELVAVEARSQRRLEAEKIVTLCKRIGIPVRLGGDVAGSVQAVIHEKGRDPVLITGSHFVVGEALAHLQRRKYLTITQ